MKTFPNVSRDVKQQITEDIESRVTSVKSGNTKKQITVSLTSSSDVQSSDSFVTENRAKDLKNQQLEQRQREARVAQWKKTEMYHKLSLNAQMAIERSMLRQKHSDFYYKLNDMCQKVFIMK